MKTMAVRDKHLRLDQRKIEIAKKILKARTETAAIERALELVVVRDINSIKIKGAMERILDRRHRLAVKGNVADWVREGRDEREKIW